MKSLMSEFPESKTIVFGGMVEIPATITYPYPPGHNVLFPITVKQNTQFRTTGNTTVLSDAMVNPRFVSRVGALPPDTPIPVLMRLDFSLRPESPATGTGSSVTSIQNLLSTFDLARSIEVKLDGRRLLYGRLFAIVPDGPRCVTAARG
jgi:hypothetical protein